MTGKADSRTGKGVTIRFSGPADIGPGIALARRGHAESEFADLPFDAMRVRKVIERGLGAPDRHCLLQAEFEEETVGYLYGIANRHYFSNALGATIMSYYVMLRPIREIYYYFSVSYDFLRSIRQRSGSGFRFNSRPLMSARTRRTCPSRGRAPTLPAGVAVRNDGICAASTPHSCHSSSSWRGTSSRHPPAARARAFGIQRRIWERIQLSELHSAATRSAPQISSAIPRGVLFASSPSRTLTSALSSPPEPARFEEGETSPRPATGPRPAQPPPQAAGPGRVSP